MRSKFKEKDNLRRVFFKKKEFSFIFYALIFKNKKIRRRVKRGWFKPKFFKRKSQIYNICVLTGRTKGVYRSFKVSRFILKGMSTVGYLPGIRKSYW